MAKTAVIFGVLLIALGLGAYLLTGAQSPTALIPAMFGFLLALLGRIAANPTKRKAAMHMAAVLGILGIAGSARGLAKIGDVLSGAPVERPAAVVAQSAMAVLMIVFVALCVKSFVDARRGRAAM